MTRDGMPPPDWLTKRAMRTAAEALRWALKNGYARGDLYRRNDVEDTALWLDRIELDVVQAIRYEKRRK